MVRSILNNYNPDSPYVSLDDWDGEPCYNCGYVTSRENTYYCSYCERDYYEECSTYCRQCEETVCLGCSGQCPHCEELVRKNCISRYTKCEELCCESCLEDGLCPNCKEEMEKENEEQECKITETNKDGGPSQSETSKSALKFGPTAWAKLLYFRDKSDNEVSGFGITEPDDLLCVRDFITVKQEVTPVSVKFDDEAVADLFENQVDLGRRSEQFARIWLHSHPGDSPEPSIIDKETFERVFGGCQWAVMFILARNNHTYAKLSFNVRPGGYVLIPTAIDYSHEFGPSSRKEWDAKYSANIQVKNLSSCYENREHTSVEKDLDRYALPCDFVDELESMNPTECQFILDELGARPDLWDDEREVIF